MAKFYITILAVSLMAIGSVLAQEAAPIPPPTPIAPPIPSATGSLAPGAAEQPAPIEPPVAQPMPPAASPQTGDQQAANGVPVTSATTAPAATGTSAQVASPNAPAVNEFQGEDLKQVFRFLARQARISLFVSDKISPTATVTVRLENKTPMEAIEIIADSQNLILEQQKGVYYIKTQEEKAKEPTVSASYAFSYAMADKVLPLLTSQLQSGKAPQFDARTNTIFYQETKSNMENIKLFLSTVDQPTRQVMIEARLVEVTANPQQAYGINYSGLVGSYSTPMTVTYGATIPPAQVNQTTGPFAVGSASPNWLDSLTHLGSLMSGQIAILNVPQMSLAMQFLNTDSDAQFLANPRVVTANNQKATIKITRNQPVPELNFNQQTATAVFSGFQDKVYGNTLVVTPSINKDNFISLSVQPEISNKVADASFTFSGATVTSPIIDTRTLDSNVLIKSGDTLAIGGLLQDEVDKTTNKVPVLGDLPGIGYMFQSHQNQRTKRNLLIFVTPTIINQGYGTGLEDQVGGLYNVGDEYADPNGWRNNAKGAIRWVPTSNRPVSADYPKPGVAPAPATVPYKADVPERDQ